MNGAEGGGGQKIDGGGGWKILSGGGRRMEEREAVRKINGRRVETVKKIECRKNRKEEGKKRWWRRE